MSHHSGSHDDDESSSSYNTSAVPMPNLGRAETETGAQPLLQPPSRRRNAQGDDYGDHESAAATAAATAAAAAAAAAATQLVREDTESIMAAMAPPALTRGGGATHRLETAAPRVATAAVKQRQRQIQIQSRALQIQIQIRQQVPTIVNQQQEEWSPNPPALSSPGVSHHPAAAAAAANGPSLIDDESPPQLPGAYAVIGLEPAGGVGRGPRRWLSRIRLQSSSRRSNNIETSRRTNTNDDDDDDANRPPVRRSSSLFSVLVRSSPSARCTPQQDILREQEQAAHDQHVHRIIRWIFVAGCLLVVLGVGVAVGVTVGGGDDSPTTELVPEDSSSSSTTTANTNPPTIAPIIQSPAYIAIRSQVEYLSLDDVLDDPISPQSLAISWLIEENDYSTYNTSTEADDCWECWDPIQLEQRYALAAFYFAMSGDRDEEFRFLNSSLHVCDWGNGDGDGDGQGVGCDFVVNDSSNHTQRIVTSLQMTGPHQQLLRGAIPAEIGALSSLQILRLVNHTTTTKSDTKLQYLQNIKALGDLSSLQVLDLSGNNIGGDLPQEFGALTNLRELYLNGNQFDESAPHSYKKLANLEILHLQDNKLNGYADTGLWAMTNLRELRLDGNGNLILQKFFLPNAPGLRHVDLNGVRLESGDFPSNAVELQNVQVFHWDEARVIGVLPPRVIGWPELHTFSMSDNFLTGTVPWESANSGLVHLDLSLNELTGTLSPLVNRMSSLEFLSLINNQFNGTLPTQLGDLSQLRVLDLSRNAFSGPVPSEFSGLTSLERLALEGNPLLNYTQSLEFLCDGKLEISTNCRPRQNTNVTSTVCSCCTCR